MVPDAPPIVPGPIPPAQRPRAPGWLIGIAVHGACVLVTCFGVPLAMGSNLWPIAGVFWSVLTLPVAAGTGAVCGWLVRKQRGAVAVPSLVVTGVTLAAALGVLISMNR